MAYVGNQPSKGQWRKLTDISAGFNGSTASFTLSVPPGTSQYYVTPGSASQLIISVGGVIQQPDVDYTVSAYTITFTTAPATGLSFFGVLAGDALNIGTPSDGTVTDSKLSNLTTVNVVNLKNPSSLSNNIVLSSSGRTTVFSTTATVVTLTDGATITPDFDAACNFVVTLGGNRTIANPTNAAAGQSGSLFLVQDATGSRTASWGANWDWPQGSVPTLTTTANAIDRVDYIVRSATSIQAVFTANYS